MGSKHNKAFGEELRFRRDEHGLSQEEVAWRAHLSRQYVSRLELGECSPSLDTMVAVAAALGTTLDVMIHGVSRRLTHKRGDDDRVQADNAE